MMATSMEVPPQEHCRLKWGPVCSPLAFQGRNPADSPSLPVPPELSGGVLWELRGWASLFLSTTLGRHSKATAINKWMAERRCVLTSWLGGKDFPGSLLSLLLFSCGQHELRLVLIVLLVIYHKCKCRLRPSMFCLVETMKRKGNCYKLNVPVSSGIKMGFLIYFSCCRERQ